MVFITETKEMFVGCFYSVRDVIAGYFITVIRTYASHGEYFGYHNENIYNTPQLASSVEYTRDVMSGSMFCPNTWGPVKVECGTD